MSDVHFEDKTFDISIRKSANLLWTLQLTTSKDMTDYYYDFVIVEEYGQTPVINKTCKVFENNWIILDLDSNESETLFSDGENYKTYYWGLILHKGEDYRDTIVPRNFEEKPEFRVYPGFEICSA